MRRSPRVISTGNQGAEPWYRRVKAVISALRRRSQPWFYQLAGFLGAIAGLLTSTAAVSLTELLLAANQDRSLSQSLTSVLLSGISFAVFGCMVGTTLYVAIRHHQHQQLRWTALSAVILGSLFAGLASGGISQIFVNGITDGPESEGAAVKVAASILIAVLLGIALSQTVPNLPATRGLAAGLSAALIYVLFISVVIVLGLRTDSACVAGLVALGPALGFALAFAETRFREAVIQVDWASNDSTCIGLGPSPVRIGGGKDDIFIPGARPNISCIHIRDGQIEHVETASGKCTALQDGSRLRINGLTMVVRTSKTSAVSGPKSGVKK